MNGKHIIGKLTQTTTCLQTISTHHLQRTQAAFTQTLKVCSSQRRGMIMSIYDLRCFCVCVCVPAAQPIDPVSKTTTPACCWGSLRESRTRGQQTSSPAGHVTLGSGTAVTSEYNVMSVLSTSSSQERLLPCIICSHWPTCWHQLRVICMKIHAGIHLKKKSGLSIRTGDRTFTCCYSKGWSVVFCFGN